MKAWVLLLWLLHSSLSQLQADAKRFDSAMVDPLTRRSPLDKNFMRFGRSSPSYTEEDEIEDGQDSGAETSKEESFLRSMRGKENFMRFGRAKSDNFMRFGKGQQENFMRFGRIPYDNFMRLGRGKQDSYMRFGRGKQDSYMRFGRCKGDNFMRFGRGKQDSYMRFGRGKDNSFMRFGRGKQDNYIRFGRGKQDSYMRFGRNPDEEIIGYPNIFDSSEESELGRNIRGKQENFMRFGKSFEEDFEDKIPISMRSGNGNSNFMRFGRGNPDNVVRIGKPGSMQVVNEETGVQKEENMKGDLGYTSGDSFSRESKAKDLNLIRFGRQPPSKNDGFIRFGRTVSAIDDNSQEEELIPQRLKRSLASSYNTHDDKYLSMQNGGENHAELQTDIVRDGLEEEYSTPAHQEDYSIRLKRSLNFPVSTISPYSESDTSVNFLAAKVHFDTEPEYRSSLFSAGLPNVIVGPEFSLLPDLNPPPAMLKRGRPGDQNFLRLG